jgi:hypothetical protein
MGYAGYFCGDTSTGLVSELGLLAMLYIGRFVGMILYWTLYVILRFFA